MDAKKMSSEDMPARHTGNALFGSAESRSDTQNFTMEDNENDQEEELDGKDDEEAIMGSDAAEGEVELSEEDELESDENITDEEITEEDDQAEENDEDVDRDSFDRKAR